MLIIDSKYKDFAEKLWGKNHEITPSFHHENLQTPVSDHPDMTLAQIDDIFVCCPESYDYYMRFLGDKVIPGKTRLLPNYPYDIAYNVLVYKNKAFGRADFIDNTVKEELKKRNIELINVNQGYSKCSCAITENGIITADDSIFDALIKNNINALKITPKQVKLPGYDYGFIGGASGMIDGKCIFFGDVTKHADYEKIKAFCDFSYIKDFGLLDIGTIFCI